jgi:hypothetical protein
VADSLVLDIGGEIGALVIHTGPELVDAEIELSPLEHDDQRFHNMVHPRRMPDGVRHSAVFPQVKAGIYTVWRNGYTRHGVVRVAGGCVTNYHWH